MNEPESDTIWLCNQIDEEFDTPTDYQIRMWKEGNETLYFQDIAITARINKIDVTNKILYTLMFTT